VVPGAGKPQALNRYSYTYNNPLRYIDPSGHCPDPQDSVDDDTSVICVDLFIQSPDVEGVAEGDGRGFDQNSDPKKSRAYLYIYVGKDGKIKRVASPQINQSCLKNGSCFGPAKGNTFTAEQDSKTGEITVKWHLLNGVGGVFKEGADLYDSLLKSPGLLLDPDQLSSWTGAAGALRTASDFLPSIDGEMKLVHVGNGKYERVYLNRDPFPSLEVYQYSKTGVDTLTARSEQYGPRYGLSDAAPRDVFYSSWYFYP
jgi:hypothetical protein